MDTTGAYSGQNLVKDDVGERCQKLFQDFLEEWRDQNGIVKYLDPVKELGKPERRTLSVSFEDVERFNQVLATVIQEDFYRVYPYLCRAVAVFAKDRGGVGVDKEYHLSFVDYPTCVRMRQLTTLRVGQLLKISGQVVRCHSVHPELVSGTFVCLECQTLIPDVEQQFKFTNPTTCRNTECSNRTKFTLDVEKSRFVDYQKVRIQETQSELPRGAVPRSVDVILRAEAVEMAQAGDRVELTGTLIVVPDVGSIAISGTRTETFVRHKGSYEADGITGLRSLGVRDLSYRTAFLACTVQRCLHTHASSASGTAVDWLQSDELTAATLRSQMSEVEWQRLYDMSNDRNLYQNLISSLFPTIHGSGEIKRGILLMLFGGVAKTTTERTQLRGDINICIVGDPSTAKSQFLKQVADFSPRAVYTSGKASTAAGLTAAIVRDEESHEFVIEAGALMLADNSVCCIDEFDKMDIKDQVAIHEAMEQQTISLTKAGVKASLNARTSILAAANPIGGRYDRAKSLRQNITLSPPLMSRFDLFFILVDECNEVTDYAIARRIIDTHNHSLPSIDTIYSHEDILRFISFAKTFKPKISDEAAEFLVDHYQQLRRRDSTGNARSSWRVTVRQLESMIRLSEAMARMQCVEHVQPKHVKEAFRLLNKSIIRVEQPDVHLEAEEAGVFEEEEAEPAAGAQGDTGGLGEVEVGHAQPKKLRLTYEEYKTMSNLIIYFMRQQEMQQEDTGSEGAGTHRADVVEWYLLQKEAEIQTEAELMELKEVVEKVIDRLTHKDQILIPLLGAGDSSSDADANPILVVHPNYVDD